MQEISATTGAAAQNSMAGCGSPTQVEPPKVPTQSPVDQDAGSPKGDAVAGARGGSVGGAVGGAAQLSGLDGLLASLQDLLAKLQARFEKLSGAPQQEPPKDPKQSDDPKQADDPKQTNDPKQDDPPPPPGDDGPPSPPGGEVGGANGGTDQEPPKPTDTPTQKPTQGPVQQSPSETVTLSNDDRRKSAKLTSSTGNSVEIWGDPHVVIDIDGKEQKFEIGYGPGSITLSDGTKISWDTFGPKDALKYRLRSFKIDSAGTENDQNVRTDDGKDESNLATALPDDLLEEFARLLAQYKGSMNQPLHGGK
jgi:hypothetical protein